MKQKKSFIVFLLLLMCAPGGAMAQSYDFTSVSPSGHTLYYHITDSSNVRVVKQKNGNLPYDAMPTGSLVIPDSVTHNGTTYTVSSLGEKVFYKCNGLTSVAIPESISYIADYAFCNCSGLTSVTVPSGVTFIGGYAFRNCSGLTSVDIQVSDSCTFAGYIFENCTSLTQPVLTTHLLLYLPAAYGNSYTMPENIRGLIQGALTESIDTLTFVSNEPPNTTPRILFPTYANWWRYPDTYFPFREMVVRVPCGALPDYRSASWGIFHNLQSDCSLRLDVITSPYNMYRFSNTLSGDNTLPGEITVDCNGFYEDGETLAIKAHRSQNPPIDFAIFIGWDDGGVELDRTFTVHNDTTLTAIFLDSVAMASLSSNNISTPVGVLGNLGIDFNNQGSGMYFIGSEASTIYSSSLWMANREHVSVNKFLTDGSDFLPGPLRADGTVSLETIRQFNRVWHLTREQIDYHIAHCGEAGYTPIPDIATWPGNGPDGCAAQLAPYYDADSNGIYNPRAGDYPVIRGDEATFSIFNDLTSLRYSKDFSYQQQEDPWELVEYENTPFGVEIHCMHYAFNEPQDNALDNTVYVHYDIFNRSAQSYDSVYLGAWTDFDIGYGFDDYIGCDVQRSMYYGYNGTEEDGPGEGCFVGVPPAQGCIILGGTADDTEESAGMTSFLSYYNSNASDFGEPSYASDYYFYLTSRSKVGRHMKLGSSYSTSENILDPDADFMFCGNTDPNFPDFDWTESTEGNAPGDRRGVGSCGPHTLAANGSLQFDLAYTTAFGNTTAWSSVESLRTVADNVTRQWQSDTTDSGRPFLYMPYSAAHEVTDGIDNPWNTDSPVRMAVIDGSIVLQGAEGMAVSIYDMMGRQLFHSEIQNSKYEIPSSTFPTGVYLIRIGDAPARKVVVIR